MRRRHAAKREVASDPRYNSQLISKMINMVMIQGKKSKAETIVYTSLETACKKLKNSNPLEVFEKALNNVKPLVEVKSRRVGGATYQVPIEVPPARAISVGMRWLRDFARNRKGKPMQEKLADEIVDAYNGQGAAIKKREDTHKMAEANRAFSHYKW